MTSVTQRQVEVTTNSPRHILAQIAPEAVPVLYDLAEGTWPPQSRSKGKTFSPVRPIGAAIPATSPRYRVLLRRRDLTTLATSWALEAGGPVEFFEWDDSGRILGPYGVRYPLYSVVPVFNERLHWCGFGINGRTGRWGGRMRAIDARIDCPVYVRSTNTADLIEGLRSVRAHPRVEEARPGLSPTNAYFDLMLRENRRTYFEARGVNQYIGPGWTSEALERAFEDRHVRAIWIAHPDRPSATPAPEKH